MYKPENGDGGGVEGGRVRQGGYYFLDLHSFELAMQDSHPILYCTKTWYHLYISDPFWWSTKNVDCFI